MKLLITFLIAAAGLFGQQANHYVASVATTALTLQAPATNGNQIQAEFASVYCTLASTITFSWNSAAATATTATIAKYPGTAAAPTATAWSASNASGGTSGPVYNVPATSERDFSMEMFRLPAGTTASNFTITTSNSCTITIQWREF